MTGGGPPPKEVDELARKVYTLIPTQFDSLANSYDSDAAFTVAVAANEVNFFQITVFSKIIFELHISFHQQFVVAGGK